MEPAPYGGFMTRTIDSENEQKDLLAKQSVEVVVNGTTETLRPDAVHVRGVDNLSTAEIEAFVNLYLNHDYESPEYVALGEPISFRVQWIDDSNANVIFKTHADALSALQRLSEEWPGVENSTGNAVAESPLFSQEYLAALVEERRARSYAASIPFFRHQKHLKELAEGQDLFEAKKAEIEEQKATEMEEDGSSVVLYIRQALQSDRKVKNAAAYSRYYLLHGEPDRTKPRPRREAGEERGRGAYAREEDDGQDLFAEKIKSTTEKKRADDIEEDLFASRLRERSPARH
ncbi:hypothetical protein OXX80_001226 [Metschnikowia pulcherrima]